MATPEEVAAMQKEAAYVTGSGEAFFHKHEKKIRAADPHAIFVAVDVDHDDFVVAMSRKEVHDKADKVFPAGSKVYVRGIHVVSPDVSFGPCLTEVNDNAR